MYDLEEVIRPRRSIRMFLPDRPVARDLIDEALDLAIRAPSNSNVQPWHVVFASGAARDRLVAALLKEARRGRRRFHDCRQRSPTFEAKRARWSTGRWASRATTLRRGWVAQLRNWEFFRAPLAGIVCIHHELGIVDSLAVGMFLQTLVLAVTARGLGTCVQVSIAGYPDIIRKQLDIPAEYTILCGLAVGYADPDFPANHIRVGRQPIEQNVVFLDDD